MDEKLIFTNRGLIIRLIKTENKTGTYTQTSSSTRVKNLVENLVGT